MTRKDWYSLLGVLLLFWLAGGWVIRPVIEQALTDRAESELADFEGVEVMFRGQQAVLRGEVRWEKGRRSAEEQVREKVRASLPVSAGIGGGLNPVTDVVNEIVVAPLDPGWMVLLSEGSKAKLLGAMATPEEARDLGEAVGRSWTAAGGVIETDIRDDLAWFDEAADLQRTLSTLPRPIVSEDPDVRAQLWAVRLGKKWERWSLNAGDVVLERDAKALGVMDEDWQERVMPEIAGLREVRDLEKRRLAEERRLAALPPPHMIAAFLGERLLLRGEMGSKESKSAFLAQVMETLPGVRVLDDIRVSAARRPTFEWGVPGRGGDDERSVQYALAGTRWAALGEGESIDELPEGLKPGDIATDLRVTREWLSGGNAGIPSLPAPPQPAFLTLAIFSDRVLLAGQIGEEAHRSHLVEKAEQVFGAKREVDASGLKVRGNCEPTDDVMHTALSFPSGDGADVIAVAKPGHEWRTIAVSPAILKARRVPESELPAEVPVEGVAVALGAAFERLSATSGGMAKPGGEP